MDSFWAGFEKQAAKDDTTWWERQKGIMRAKRRSDSGAGMALNSNEAMKTIGKGSLGGAGIGGALGAAGGALLGRGGGGVGAGASLGVGLGSLIGAVRGEKKFLASKGIKHRLGGFDAEYSPEAKKKFIDKYRKK